MEAEGEDAKEAPPNYEPHKSSSSPLDEAIDSKESKRSERRNPRGDKDPPKGKKDNSSSKELADIGQTSKEEEPKVTMLLSNFLQMVQIKWLRKV